MKPTITALIFSAVFAAGCASWQSLNLQRSGLRSAGDVTVTAYLDHAPADAWEAHATEIRAVLERLQAFVADGAVQNLVYPQLVEAVRGLVPADYRSLANLVLDAVQHTSADVDVDSIGADNVARIRAVLQGVATGLRRYEGGHRPPVEGPAAEAGSTPTELDVPVDRIDMPPDEDMDPPAEGDDG